MKVEFEMADRMFAVEANPSDGISDVVSYESDGEEYTLTLSEFTEFFAAYHEVNLPAARAMIEDYVREDVELQSEEA